MDVYHRKAQAKAGFTLVRLDAGDELRDDEPDGGAWRGWLAWDNRQGPADQACFRVNFRSWLDGLHPMKRQVAELLAEGYEGVAVAKLVGLSPGRVSQLRTALEASWAEFQAQAGGGERRRAAAAAV